MMSVVAKYDLMAERIPFIYATCVCAFAHVFSVRTLSGATTKMDELIKYMRALVLLQVHAPTPAGASAGPKPEVLLARAGFPHKEIADLLGKSAGAVAKSVSRAKARVVADDEPAEATANE